MTKEKLEDAIQEVLISLIVERVIEKIALYQKKALVVFTGSLMGFEKAMEGLGKLRKEGFTFHVFLTESALALLDILELEKTLQPEEIYQEGNILPEQLAKDFETVIVPAMTINTAAKLACCIADAPAVRIISNAMMRGKNVIIGVDGCCPDNKERAVKGYQMTEGLKNQLRENMKKIASYGGYLTTLDELYDVTKKRVLHQEPKGKAENKKAETHKHSQCSILSKKVIGSVDILSNAGCSSIKISKNALITKLAEETAQKHKIQLIRE